MCESSQPANISLLGCSYILQTFLLLNSQSRNLIQEALEQKLLVLGSTLVIIFVLLCSFSRILLM